MLAGHARRQHRQSHGRRSDRSEGPASPVRYIDPATYQPSEAVRQAMQQPLNKLKRQPDYTRRRGR